MRNKKRAIPREEAVEILERAEYGVLSTVSENGMPYGVPLNYCLIDDCIYFHCALEGQKIDNIEQNRSISFCAVGETEVLPEKFATHYESVIVAGEIDEVFGNVKQIALEGLVKKYCPDFMEKGMKYIKRDIDKTRVFKITIKNLTGKAHR
ncbi:pyridoxamine 5'-phosphate oxidase family protein [bacterium]|nr:pyridoxamine 5'-phosphate oxidase family protein [bacterium]